MSECRVGVFICSLCNTRSPSLPLWMSHLRLVHHEEDCVVQCPVQDCDAFYSKVNSLCSHVYRKHRGIYAISSARSTCQDVPKVSGSGIIIIDFFLPSSLSHDVNQLLQRDAHEQKKKSSIFLLQLKEECMLTQVAINDVVSGCREVFQHTVGHLRAGVSQKLSQSGIDASDINGFGDVFSEIADPFFGLETS